VNPAERTTVGDDVDDPSRRHGSRGWIDSIVHRAGPAGRADDQNVLGDLRKHGELTLQNRPAVHDKRALVPAAEPGCPTAGENRGTLHLVILDPGGFGPADPPRHPTPRRTVR